MTVTNRQAHDNLRPDDGFNGWQRIVAALIVAVTALGTLWLTGSIQYAAVVTALVFVPLGLTLRKSRLIGHGRRDGYLRTI
jgi:hypothetical protein